MSELDKRLREKACEECSVTIVKSPKWTYKEWDKKRYCSQRCHGKASMPVVNDLSKFWSQVEKTSYCWNWTGKLHRGYSQYSYQGKTHRAYRLAYELANGAIPEGKQLDHLCRNTACVNPSHLEPVTQQENMARGESPSAINARKTECINGHEYTPENTYRSAQGRHCKICRRAAYRKWAIGRASGITDKENK